MDKRQVIGGAFQFMLMGGSWMRLAMWTKRDERRSLDWSLAYPSGEPVWKLRLMQGDETVFDGASDSLQGVTVLAVAALGKNL